MNKWPVWKVTLYWNPQTLSLSIKLTQVWLKLKRKLCLLRAKQDSKQSSPTPAPPTPFSDSNRQCFKSSGLPNSKVSRKSRSGNSNFLVNNASHEDAFPPLHDQCAVTCLLRASLHCCYFLQPQGNSMWWLLPQLFGLCICTQIKCQPLIASFSLSANLKSQYSATWRACILRC